MKAKRDSLSKDLRSTDPSKLREIFRSIDQDLEIEEERADRLLQRYNVAELN